MAVIAVTKETRANETRVAATPETVKKLGAAGFSLWKMIPATIVSCAILRGVPLRERALRFGFSHHGARGLGRTVTALGLPVDRGR